MIGQPCENVREVGLWVDSVALVGVGRRVDFGAAFGTGESPVGTSGGNVAQGSVGDIVSHADAAVVEEASLLRHCPRPEGRLPVV